LNPLRIDSNIEPFLKTASVNTANTTNAINASVLLVLYIYNTSDNKHAKGLNKRMHIKTIVRVTSIYVFILKIYVFIIIFVRIYTKIQINDWLKSTCEICLFWPTKSLLGVESLSKVQKVVSG
jgi:hypothetical protein